MRALTNAWLRAFCTVRTRGIANRNITARIKALSLPPFRAIAFVWLNAFATVQATTGTNRLAARFSTDLPTWLAVTFLTDASAVGSTRGRASRLIAGSSRPTRFARACGLEGKILYTPADAVLAAFTLWLATPSVNSLQQLPVAGNIILAIAKLGALFSVISHAIQCYPGVMATMVMHFLFPRRVQYLTTQTVVLGSGPP